MDATEEKGGMMMLTITITGKILTKLNRLILLAKINILITNLGIDILMKSTS